MTDPLAPLITMTEKVLADPFTPEWLDEEATEDAYAAEHADDTLVAARWRDRHDLKRFTIALLAELREQRARVASLEREIGELSARSDLWCIDNVWTPSEQAVEIQRLREMPDVMKRFELQRENDRLTLALGAAQDENNRLGMENFELAAMVTFVKGGDIPETLEGARKTLTTRMLAAESSLRLLQAEIESCADRRGLVRDLTTALENKNAACRLLTAERDKLSRAIDYFSRAGAEARELVRLFRGWDHLPLLADGPFWMAEADKVLADPVGFMERIDSKLRSLEGERDRLKAHVGRLEHRLGLDVIYIENEGGEGFIKRPTTDREKGREDWYRRVPDRIMCLESDVSLRDEQIERLKATIEKVKTSVKRIRACGKPSCGHQLCHEIDSVAALLADPGAPATGEVND